MDSGPNNIERHLVAEFIGDAEGPTLMAFGGIHGNEAAGAAALKQVADELRSVRPHLKGRVYFFRGNARALAKGVRFVDRDLNRHWTPENVVRNMPDSMISPQLSEDSEQAELLRYINGVVSSAKNEVIALDLHSTSAVGIPFATVGDTMRNRTFAKRFPVTILLGIEEQLEGTLLEFLNNLGCVTLGYEAGQHYADSTIVVHEALVWRALVNSGILDDNDELKRYDDLLLEATKKPRIYEVRHRHAITSEDDFKMLPGFNNFDSIRKGQILAVDRVGKVCAPDTGLILMPLYQTLGEDGFFVGREIAPFWIGLSGLLRRLKIGSLMRFLPGVHVSKTDTDTFEIDTNVARFFPLQIFHLLGFRKRRWREKKLVVSRRKFDTVSPFVS